MSKEEGCTHVLIVLKFWLQTAAGIDISERSTSSWSRINVRYVKCRFPRKRTWKDIDWCRVRIFAVVDLLNFELKIHISTVHFKLRLLKCQFCSFSQNGTHHHCKISRIWSSSWSAIPCIFTILIDAHFLIFVFPYFGQNRDSMSSNFWRWSLIFPWNT